MNHYDYLDKYFGYDSYKEGQEVLIDSIIKGKDALGVMPTGGGKSMCYQLPALMLDGITIVISPLIALMKDQVDGLIENGLPASFINSTLSEKEFHQTIDEIVEGKYKLVYVAPERLDSSFFRHMMYGLDISMIAIDEAHCISQWGHDFRPAYTQIPDFIDSLSERPIISAFTATATDMVIDEIIELLRLDDPVKSIIGFDRPNLFYKVLKIDDKINYITDFIDNNYKNNSGIIYCSTRKSVESLNKILKDKGYSTLPYHGGMSMDIRNNNQNKFMNDKVDIIIATNAFGMGIDKPDIRYVIHYNMPQNMEAYYQEAGRAGRDGLNSHCLLMYSPADIVKQKLLIQSQTQDPKRTSLLNSNLQYLIDYCHTNHCLRGKILEYFNETPKVEKCGNCGNCLSKSELVDITEEAQKILSCIYRANERFGINIIALTLKGSKDQRVLKNGLDNISTYGIMKEYDIDIIKDIIMNLISLDYIFITTDKYPVLRLSNTSREVLNGQVKVYHKKDLLEKKTKKKKTSNTKEIDLTNPELFEELRQLRYSISQEKGIPPFIIFHNSSLEEMSEYKPKTKSEFLDIKGVGEKKYESYGQEFIELIKEF